MLERYEKYEAEYRRRIGVATALTLAVQVLVLVLGHRAGWSPVQAPDPLHLGYPGPKVVRPELEVLEAKSVQAYFYQKAREGRARAIEYRLLMPLEENPGPNPMLIPETRPRQQTQSTRSQTATEPAPDAVPDVVVPLQATHSDIAYSEDFQIVKLVKPAYPEYELSRGIRARLLVAVWVTPLGDLELEQIQEATTDPPQASSQGFELATLEAVRQWKVRPPRSMLGSQGMWILIPVQFDPAKDEVVDFDGVRRR